MVVLTYLGEEGTEAMLATAHAWLDPLATEWTRFEHWTEFQRAALTATGPVLIWASAGDDVLAARAATLESTLGTGLVITGPPRSEGDGVVSGAVACLACDLGWALHRAHASNFLRQQALRVETSVLSDMMKRFVEVALVSDPPLVTVEELANRCRRSAQDLWYHWRHEIRTTSPKELLQWIVLVRATVGRPDGASWEDVAKRVPANPQRLRRTARALLDTTLTEAAENHGDDIMEHVEKRLTAVLESKERPAH